MSETPENVVAEVVAYGEVELGRASDEEIAELRRRQRELQDNEGKE